MTDTNRRTFLTGAAAIGAAVGALAPATAGAEVRFPTERGKYGACLLYTSDAADE